MEFSWRRKYLHITKPQETRQKESQEIRSPINITAVAIDVMKSISMLEWWAMGEIQFLSPTINLSYAVNSYFIIEK